MGKSTLPRYRKPELPAASSDNLLADARRRWHTPRVVRPLPAAHPLVDGWRRRGIPITILILVGWLVWHGWTVQNIAWLLLICAPELAPAPRPADR